MTVRLQKYLAECGVASRRACEDLIRQARVTVNADPATLGQKIDPEADAIAVDGEDVALNTKVYVVLNKPKGVVTTTNDPHCDKTVLDCISGVPARIFPVGRLDKDVTGTLILTNDGELTFRLSHPKYEIDKVYMAWVRGEVSKQTVGQLQHGVKLDDGYIRPSKVAVVKSTSEASLLRIVVHEGRKRLVKRMCAAIGHPVKNLRRVSVGNVRAQGLMPGEWRYLNDEEIARLRTLTKLAH